MRLGAGLLAFGWGCGEGTAPPPPVATVSVETTPPVNLVPGGTQLLSALAKDAKGNSLPDRQTTWTSSDETKVTVAAGLVTGVAVGSATVTASVEGRTASVEVRVKDGAVVSSSGTSFSAQNGNVNVVVPPSAVAQTTNFTVDASTSAPASTRLVTGTSFDFGPSASTLGQPVTITIKYNPASIPSGYAESGLQLYEAVGTAWRVIAGSTVNTSTKTVTGNVTRLGTFAVMGLPKVETVTIGGDLSAMPVVTTRQLSTTLKDNEGTTLTRPVTWTSSDPAILAIDGGGLATSKRVGTVTITAASEGKSATATITVVPGPPARFIPFAGNNQSVAAGAQVPVPPSVLITDAADNPIAGVTVNFAVASGGGTVTGAAATTNAAGIAAVGSWTLGTAAGPNSLTATTPAIAGATFTFQAAGGAGPAAVIVAVGGNNQTATAGGLVGTPPSVKVTDANGNFVSGYTVTFTPASGSGSVTSASVVTDPSGIATVGGWRLGPTPGPQSLLAIGNGLSGSPVTFNAIAVAPVPSTIAGFAGNNQTARPGSPVATPPSVRITDPAGIPVPGVAVTFEVTGGGGTVSGGTATTNADGIAAVASWVLGPTTGTNTLTATAGSLSGSPVVFSATAAALPPTAMAIVAGDNQTALAGQPVPIAPSVKITDAEGLGVAGVTVTFSIRSGGGSLTGANAVTNTAGIATLQSWVLGIGGNSLYASVPGLSGDPLIFVALGQAQVQVVTFGDSNTDIGFQGTSPIKRVASYVSSADPNIRLAPNAPHSTLQLAGKIEARWRANRSQTFTIVNHGISGTTSGAGRTIVFAPNALEVVGGFTRYQGEVLGMGYPWSGGEPVNEFYPNGAIQRVNAFKPRTSDFAYVSMGTNDILLGGSPTAVRNNLEIMIDQWTGQGLPANRFIVTTLPPLGSAGNSSITTLNGLIRTLAQQKGVRLVDIASFTSSNGVTWANPSLHVGDFIHYSEAVRDWIADQVVSIMFQLNP
ncbi:MAG TPA: SGNH/GDSL hydrolase family protein [Gemmatimonadaceae bacterium]|nr:SGNH/GDSL hydrolase family protein [Gemmatimonadaceae bacterium]